MPKTDQLPRIDEHSILIDTPRGRAWDALLGVAERSVGAAGAPRYARLVGCEDTEAGGPRPLGPGSTMPGFHVESATAPGELALAGAHRFSDYGLIFRLEEAGEGRTRVRAETRADFPGLKGQAYKTLVIRTRGHVLAVRRVLAATKRRAERG
ncbi:MAG TPA: hypothetical protein VIT85_07130 [Solirubrobacterales bacterium]